MAITNWDVYLSVHMMPSSSPSSGVSIDHGFIIIRRATLVPPRPLSPLTLTLSPQLQLFHLPLQIIE
jgi:hypothetical protein